MLQKYLTIKQDLLSVMTFNIRFDGLERDSNNHFTKRIYRLTETVEKWQPAILSVQEPLTSQFQHWQSHLPKYYQSIGYEHDRINKRVQHSLSHMDFQVAILYNDKILKLLEQDYLWLSKTPRTVGSKDWDSNSIRTLNIARFELISDDDNPINILVFNTHLDSHSEQARQEQAKIVRSTINQWQRRYPTDVILLFGDFNSIPNQTTYNILTSSDFLYDTWTVCKSRPSICVLNSFSSTYHGWLGSIVNTYGAQFLQTIVFTFHGLGVIVPHEIPRNYSSYIDILKNFTKFSRRINLSEMMSLWSSGRFHVDWILYQNSMDGSQHLEPRFISVSDIRSRNYSSDHFPVIALFHLRKNTEN